MGIKSILSVNQKKLLKEIYSNKEIGQYFYLTGGTALSEFYLHHRLSEDLDFFSENEVDPQAISVFLKSLSKKVGLKKIDSQQSFNRYLFFLHFSDGNIVKIEFTYFPFLRIEKKQKIENLFIDSLLDIAVNKLFTIYQKPRSRDFIDLYLILKKKKWRLTDLIKKVQIKFDWYIDPLQLGAQFLKVKEVKDFPRMIKKIEKEKWQGFFLQEAKKLKEKILE